MTQTGLVERWSMQVFGAGVLSSFPKNVLYSSYPRSALPLRATLSDADGNVVTGGDLTSAPVVQVLFTSAEPESEPELIDEELLVSIHDADSGNLFVYMPLSQEWQFNLSARPLEAPETYEISMESGDTDEYVFPDSEKCTSKFTRVR